jgi:hypothetical protein
MILEPIKNTDLTQVDLDLVSDILNDYLEYFDFEDELNNGVADPQAKLLAVESLYGRLTGVDLSEPLEPHHVDCVCDWCELERGN